MPEYLAPGVYVEETSFRAKSIEGVGTSTTAFVGPTRKGPIAQPGSPIELLTSFADFERIYGGLDDLSFGPGAPPARVTNFIAHSVLQFFNEGGARLYVARVANQPVAASTANLRSGAAADESVFIRSRFAGLGGEGRVTLSEIATSSTPDQLDDYGEGAFLRLSDPAARTASFEGGPLPVNLATLGAGNVVLNLFVNGNDAASQRAITFAGDSARVTGTADLADPIVVDAAGRDFRLRVNGALQVVQLPAGNTARGDLPGVLNALLAGVTTALDGNRLQLTTQRRGASARIEVLSSVLGFQSGAVSAPQTPATNTVNDLSAVSFSDLALRVAVLNAALPGPLLDLVELPGGRFALRSRLATSGASLAVRAAGAGEVSAHTALGLPAVGVVAPGAGAAPAFYQRALVGQSLQWHLADAPNTPLDAAAWTNRAIEIITFSVVFDDADGGSVVYDDLAIGSRDARFVGTALRQIPTARADALLPPIYFEIGGNVSQSELYGALFAPARTQTIDGRNVATHDLTGGNDGQYPMVGAPTDAGSYAAAFDLLQGVEDISIVAAPGHSDNPSAEAIRNALIAHAERPRAYRIAVLDSPRNQLPGDVRIYRSRFDSTRAALYYPWVTVPNPLARPGRADAPKEINLPPSGFICGIYARNDVDQSVAKAPANEIVRGALRFESDINFAQQQMLNPLGVNCLRFFPGRGLRVWGARTSSSDPEWKYVNVRRFFLYLEASIDRGTQWAVFENNGPRLWANIRETIEAFLYNEWVSGNLLGATAKEAYFVRCDRSTMTQNDLDNGRLICLIGVAALKPAEFVIFRIGQKTADDRT